MSSLIIIYTLCPVDINKFKMVLICASVISHKLIGNQ